MSERKLSKSNQDPKQILTDRDQLDNLLSKTSEHFMHGTYVMYGGRRARVSKYARRDSGFYLTLAYEDGTFVVVKPMALNR